jgi:acyl-CoA hydrolase
MQFSAEFWMGAVLDDHAVLVALGHHTLMPQFEMYTEVLQDSVVDLICAGRVKFASTCALALSPPALDRVYSDLNFFRSRTLMRPQEISNHPEVIRRLGLISINTAIEVDLFGNVNSTHIMGRQMMNGIGGSGDFTRNAYLSIFICPSSAKGGKISTVVPLVSHVDHSEHSVQVIVTEHGIADLRGPSPHERAEMNAGYNDYPGCFRCHDGNHNVKNEKGAASVTNDCSTCHNLLATDEPNPKLFADLGLH